MILSKGTNFEVLFVSLQAHFLLYNMPDIYNVSFHFIMVINR